MLSGCSLIPTRTVTKTEVVEVEKIVPVTEYVYVTPSESERSTIEHPTIEGNTWGDVLELIGEYKTSLDSANMRIERIWFYIDNYKE